MLVLNCSAKMGGAMDEDLEKVVWEGMLDADHDSRYWSAMTLRYIRRERYVKIFLAIVASATVAGWGFWKEATMVWQALSILAALMSIALPIIDIPRQVEAMTELHEGWCQLQQEYEGIWAARRSVSESDLGAKLGKLREMETKLSKKATKLPNDDEKLGAKTYYDVLRERGLTQPKKGDSP
jgi:hypothetical protein